MENGLVFARTAADGRTHFGTAPNCTCCSRLQRHICSEDIGDKTLTLDKSHRHTRLSFVIKRIALFNLLYIKITVDVYIIFFSRHVRRDMNEIKDWSLFINIRHNNLYGFITHHYIESTMNTTVFTSF